MQNVLSGFVKWVLAEMNGYVPLNVVLNKIIVDHAKAEFREFRDTILGMLDTYRYEERILATANHLLQEDVQNRVRVLHRVRIMCCDALSGIMKTDSFVYLVLCGHWTGQSERIGGARVIALCGVSFCDQR